ncbi:MAG: hypothetical protein ABFS08_10200 [Pseudomonadota bacterium]
MYFLDSDVVKKTAQYDLFNELVDSYESETHNFYVLPELKFQLHLKNKDKSVKKLGSEGAFAALSTFLDSACEVDSIPTGTANEILTLNQTDLDIGEQTLLAAVSSSDEGKMISGDKRAFISISKIDHLSSIDDLWPYLICFENALQKIVLSQKPFESISQKIRNHPDADSSIKISFGVSFPADIDSVMQALESYINDLVSKTSGKYLKS